MDLEKQITKGRLAWIVNLVYDKQARTLAMEFTRDPETLVVYGTLVFSDVCNCQSVLDYEEDRAEFEAGRDVENLVGIQKMKDDAEPGYFIKTDIREISFNTEGMATWTPIQELGTMS